jgi:hypothetical protein
VLGTTRALGGGIHCPQPSVAGNILIGDGGCGDGALDAGTRNAQAERVALVRGGQGDRDQYTHAQTRKDKVMPKD